MTLETVISELPALVSVTVNDAVLPIATVPKFRLDVLDVSTADAAIPTPLKETALVELVSLTIVTLPDSAPADFGVKTMFKLDCFPAAMTRGKVAPETVTPAAVELALEMVKSALPLFVIVTDCEALLPTATEPKLMDAGATVIAALLEVLWLEAGFDAPVRPMHPEVDKIARNKKMKAEAEMTLMPLKR